MINSFSNTVGGEITNRETAIKRINYTQNTQRRGETCF